MSTDTTREASPEVETRQVLGTLELVARKSGKVVSAFPVDAERVTIGRDYDCDVRLYLPDVSKLHAELQFDVDSGSACLIVHGSNGVVHTPAGGQQTNYIPPNIIVLADGDTFAIRKKLFRFTYGDGGTQLGYSSPVAVRVMPASPAKASLGADSSSTPLRRRASHRLSIVPEGRRFKPSPMKRRPSTLGLLGATPVPSALSTEVEADELEFEELVDVAEGDEGDKLYLERKDEEPEEPKAASNPNPFLTPQPKRRADPRNTSVAPRTRKPVPPPPAPGAFEDAEEEPAPLLMPKTPKSIPLPLGGETPYASPAKAPSSPTPPVSAHLAYSTPRGSDSLRKALLLRSARKVFETTRQFTVETELGSSKIETRRRKSSSPGSISSRRKSSPAPVAPVEAESESSSEEDSFEDADDKENHPLQWVYEDGQVDVSFDDSDSDRDSVEADVSLPGQFVFNAHPDHVSDSEEDDGDDEGEYDESEEDESDREDGSAPPIAFISPVVIANAQDVEENSDEELEESAEYSIDDLGRPVPVTHFVHEVFEVNDGEEEEESEEELEEHDEDESEELEERDEHPQVEAGDSEDDEADISADVDVEVDRDELVTEATPPRQLPSRFYTPQVQRQQAAGPRMSLAGIGGPPVRFVPIGTPQQPHPDRFVPTPGNMGKPSRPPRTPAREVEEVEPEVVVPPRTPRVAATPSRRPASVDVKKQRELLATPRALPAPPESGFRSPVQDDRKDPHPLTNLFSTPSHRALAASPDPGPVVPRTPMDDIKRRLGALRLQTASGKKTAIAPSSVGAHPAPRRATVGFVLPDTPSRTPVPSPSVSMSASAGDRTYRTRGVAPVTPRVAVIEEGESESLPPTPTTGAEVVLESAMLAPATEEEEEEEVEDEQVAGPSTPSYVGLRDMLKQPAAPKTPAFDGLRQLLKTPKVDATPSFAGVREMLRQPKPLKTPAALNSLRHMLNKSETVESPDLTGVREVFRPAAPAPPTPSFKGVREMYAERHAPPTPALDGIADMYADAEEDDAEEGEEEEHEPEPEEVPEPVKEMPVKEMAPVKAAPPARSRLPTRSARGAKAADKLATTDKPAASRAEPIAAPEPKARSTRTRTAVRKEPEPVSAPARSSRTTRAKSAAVSEAGDDATAATEERAATVPVAAPAPKAPTRRTVSARSTRATASPEVEAEPPKAEAPKPAATKTRTRKVLGDAEQPQSKIPPPAVRSRSKAAGKAAKDETTASAPTRKSAATAPAVADKENSADDAEPASAPTRRRAAAVKADAKLAAVSAPARATRSRRNL
ncbi:uncharacterized protein LOC62_03G003689 [Vanrija pseudolonga]|uniref:FHA domain-containing protein n=1 Tax=Vanrija pseudolonga TaxID=143232 RepID=A0AAF0Y4K0_9TREE|nr:hypothetical protein LOC62_03G003689 [Vanrija pseudolonga]